MPTLKLISQQSELPTIELKIQGKLFYFIVDTGCEYTCISPSVPFTLNAAQRRQILPRKVLTGGGLRKDSIVPVTFRLLEIELHNICVSDMFDKIDFGKNVSISGVIGQDILSQFSQVIFDYKKQTVEFKL